ncbi:hypothetical protein ABMA28_001437 [Loxostege sticticalis]|uniref:FLYWCH-type domain-containing protein n=1 Tax=Loxostege sticticalis TaxID=481309 RepID=A0ABD0T1N1_LOXSC
MGVQHSRLQRVQIEFLISKKGKTLIAFEGYTYRRAYLQHGVKVRWVCSKKKNCPGRIYTQDDQDVIIIKGEHNH